MDFAVNNYKERNKGMGGSDAAAALGVSPFKKPMQLWKEKTGRVQPYDISRNAKVQWGHKLEPVIVKMYEEQTGKTVDTDCKTVYHPKYPWMFGHADGLLVEEKRGFEAKTASDPKKWRDGVPEHYRIQCMHYAAIYGYYHWDIAVLINGSDFRIYKLNFTNEEFDWLIKNEKRFWDCVCLDKLCNQVLEIRSKIKTLNEEKGILEESLKELIGESDVLLGPDGITLATYKESERKMFDSKALKADNESLYNIICKIIKNANIAI